MKIKIKCCIVIIILAIIFLTGKTKASSSYLFLDELKFEAQIQQDGSMDITEYWDIEIEETNTLYKTFKIDKNKYDNISNVIVTDITDGKNQAFTKISQEMYHVTKNSYYALINKKGLFEIAWGVGLDNSSDKRKYKIQYTVNGAISKYQDKAELYWQFVGEDFEINAQKVTGTIRLPENVSAQEEIKIWGHTEDLNGEIHVVDNNKIQFIVNGRNQGNFIEIRTLFPTEMIISATRSENKEILQKVIEEETVWANEANQRRERKQMKKNIIAIIEVIICIIVSAILIKGILKKKKQAQKLTKLQPTQNIVYFREIPRENATPAQALYLYKKQTSSFISDEIGKIFSATLLDLSLKQYLSFEISKDTKGKEIIYIKQQKEVTEKLTKEEVEILEFITQASKGKEKITVKELEKYIQQSQSKVIKLKENIDKIIPKTIQENGLENEQEKQKYNKCGIQVIGVIIALILSIIIGAITGIELTPFVWIGIIPLIIIEIIYLVTLSNLQGKINVFTQKGIDEIEKWKGLKKYMEEFSLLKEKEVPQLVLWEKFLVYATVFGIAEKVLKQLKIIYPNMEEITNVNNYTYLYFMLNTNFTSSFTKAVSTSMSSSYTSATGSGGGFSGRRRRRPVAGGGGGGR